MARVAFMTAAMLKEAWEHPASEGFVKRIDAVVQTMENADGFIASDFDESSQWGEFAQPAMLDRPEFQGKYAYTLSLWADLESVFAFAYHAAHGEALHHRHDWFMKADWPVYVAWWVEDEHMPTFAEAVERFELLRTQGPTPAAFTFHHAFDAQGNPLAIDRQKAREKTAHLPAIDWREIAADGDET